MRDKARVQQHGGIQADELAALGLSACDVLDFSANVNPLGPPPGVRAALTALDVSRYPDPDCRELRGALAELLDVPPEWLLAGNGASELIHLVVRLFVHRGQRPVVFAPTFSEFERAVEAAGGHAYAWTAGAQRGFRWALRNKPGVLDRVRPPLVWLCNPNNPTGVYLQREQVAALAGSLSGGPLLLDESYVTFVDNAWNALDLTRNGRVIVLRSMTKDFALAGLRLGYLVAEPALVEAARALQPAWSVNSAAQAAGLAALRSPGYLEQARGVVAEAKGYLEEALAGIGLPIVPGAANFMLVRVGDATGVRAQLLERGIAVRDCTSFGLPEFIRVGVRRLDDCRRLVKAIEALHLQVDFEP